MSLRRTPLALAALCASFAVLALSAAPAFAERSYESQLTGFSQPWGIAIDGSENVWIDDSGNSGEIYEYSSSNAPLGSRESEGHYGSNIRGIAVDNSTGRLYVADSGPVYIDVFKSGLGEYEETWPTENGSGYIFVAVDNSGGPTQGRVYVARSSEGPQHIQALRGADEPSNFSGSASYISENHITGTPTGEIGEIKGIATDSSGNLYVVDGGNKVVDEFSSSGVFVRAFTGAGAPTVFSENLTGVAVDPTNGNVLIVDGGDDVVDEFSETGEYLAQLPANEAPAHSFGSLPGGIAVNSSGYVYVTDGGNGVVDIFTPTAILPKVTYGAVTNQTQTSGTLHVEINLNEGPEVTECKVEYGTTTAYGSSVPCSPAPPYTSETGVSAELTGLTTETTYQYRVVLTTENGTKNGSDQTFTPHAVAGLSTEAATNLAPASATLNASFVGDGEDTHYYFEWGTTTAYGNQTAVPPGEDAGSPMGPGPTAVSFNLTGLEPETTYHYRVVAKDGFGTSIGQDRELTTMVAVAGLSTEAATNLAPASATLNASFVGDGEDTHYYFEWGTTTAYGNRTAVPPGEDAGSPMGPSPTAVSFNLTGLAPETPYHYRVVAEDGFGTTVGPDERFSTTPPDLPVIESTSSSAGAAGTTAVLEAQINPGFGATVFRFQYGISAAYGSSTPISESIGSDGSDHLASANISGLTPGTTYHYRAVAISFTGTTHGPDRTFTTPDLPLVNGTSVSNVTQTTATLAAQINPEFAATTYRFQYGTDASYGSSTPQSAAIGSDNSVHAASAAISGLQPGTTYHYRVVATNAIGTSDGPDQTFSTAPPVVTAPVKPPPVTCKKGFVKKHGKCVKKKRHHKKRHHG